MSVSKGLELNPLPLLFNPEPCGVHPPRDSWQKQHVALHHRVSSSLLDPVDPSFRALSEHLKFTVRRQKFNKDSLLTNVPATRELPMPAEPPPPKRYSFDLFLQSRSVYEWSPQIVTSEVSTGVSKSLYQARP